MRSIIVAVVAAFFAVVSLGASAATVGSSQAVKPSSTYQLIQKKAKTYKKATKAKAGKAKAKKGKLVRKGKAKKMARKFGKKGGGKKSARPGRCGIGKYYSKGKCVEPKAKS